MSFKTQSFSKVSGFVRDGYLSCGTTAERPKGLGQREGGITYFDTETGEFLVWHGSDWAVIGKTDPVHVPEPTPAPESSDSTETPQPPEEKKEKKPRGRAPKKQETPAETKANTEPEHTEPEAESKPEGEPSEPEAEPTSPTDI